MIEAASAFLRLGIEQLHCQQFDINLRYSLLIHSIINTYILIQAEG